jgi:HlyD family secretion protein
VSANPEAPAPVALRIASALFEIETGEPIRASRTVLWTVCVLVAVLIVWVCFAKLDIVAVANGRLVPETYVKVVQPAEAGIIREILVDEGQRVEKGEVLVRLDPTVNAVDTGAIGRELELERLQLRRIEAELAGTEALERRDADRAELAGFHRGLGSRQRAGCARSLLDPGCAGDRSCRRRYGAVPG